MGSPPTTPRRRSTGAPSPPLDEPTYKHLTTGHRYRVARAFTDFDGTEHPVDETWLFVGASHAPYDDGLTLTIELEDGAESAIFLQDRAGSQDLIIAALDVHIVAA